MDRRGITRTTAPLKARLQRHNSTRRRVRSAKCLQRRQRNSTRLTYFALIGCTLFNWVSGIADRRRQLSCVGESVYSDASQLNSTRRRVASANSDPPTQLKLCRYKRAFRGRPHNNSQKTQSTRKLSIHPQMITQTAAQLKIKSST